MTKDHTSVIDWSDPTTAHFWAAAREGVLVIQHCLDCRAYQFYPRPFCLTCDSDQVRWAPATGLGTVYSQTTIHLPPEPGLGLTAPYVVAIVELDEGPRILTNLAAPPCRIGDRVQLSWRERSDQAPVPIFVRTDFSTAWNQR